MRQSGAADRRFSVNQRRLAAVIVIIVLLVLTGAPSCHRAWHGVKNTEDFEAIYQAACAIWNHQDIRAATDRFYTYSPFIAFILQPLAVFPEHAAALVWIVINAVLISGASMFAAKEIVKRWRPNLTGKPDASLPWLIAAGALLLSFDKLRADFRLMQIDGLLVLGFALILPWLEKKSWIRGLIVGATANVKYLALIFLPYFIVKRNFLAAIVAVVSFFLLIMLPAVEVGFPLAVRYAGDAMAVIGRLTNLAPPVSGQPMRVIPVSWDRSISFTSAISRTADAHGFSDSISNLLTVIAFMIVVGGIILIARYHGVRLFAFGNSDGDQRRGAIVSLEWAALIVLALVFSPQTMARHFLLLTFVYMVAMSILMTGIRNPSRAVLVLAVLIAFVGLIFPFRALGLDALLKTWRAMAGASWCALILILAVTWSGAAALSERAKSQSGS